MTGRRVCCRGLGVQMLLVDSGGRRAPQQQHGAQTFSLAIITDRVNTEGDLCPSLMGVRT